MSVRNENILVLSIESWKYLKQTYPFLLLLLIPLLHLFHAKQNCNKVNILLLHLFNNS
jgi:hypothetical protein